MLSRKASSFKVRCYCNKLYKVLSVEKGSTIYTHIVKHQSLTANAEMAKSITYQGPRENVKESKNRYKVSF